MKPRIAALLVGWALVTFAQPTSSHPQDAEHCIVITVSGAEVRAPDNSGNRVRLWVLRNTCDDWITAIYCFRFQDGYRNVNAYGCGQQIGLYYNNRVAIPPNEETLAYSPSNVPAASVRSIKGGACHGTHGYSEHREDFDYKGAFDHILYKEDGTVICPKPK